MTLINIEIEKINSRVGGALKYKSARTMIDALVHLCFHARKESIKKTFDTAIEADRK